MDCDAENRGALRSVPFMGVIYVVAEASKLGFYNGNPDWCNLGQGQPEVGEMEGAPKRISNLQLEPSDHAYGPLGGNTPFKEKIAKHYNRLYRSVNGEQQFGPENVSVASGGRLALTRIFAALGDCSIGFIIPDYTAYEDLFNYHIHHVKPVCVETLPQKGFKISPEEFEKVVVDNKLKAFLLSNPCNPTGQVISGEDLKKWIAIATKHSCTLILDEFYSHFIYDNDKPGSGPISAAPLISDINKQPILMVDGLTKSFRYPGWRVGWIIGPKEMIGQIDRAASAIDGGPSQPIQRLAMQVLEPSNADRETTALRNVFCRKRNIMLTRLKKMGIEPIVSDGINATFYIWASIANLPHPLNDGMTFFQEALKHKVMVVPGVFFDVNPGKMNKRDSPYKQWLRFSFGPHEENMKLGLDRLQAMLNSM